MTRALILTLASLALLAAPAGAARNMLREEARQTVAVHDFTSLRVENSRGDVELGPSADGEVHLTALKLIRSGSADESRRLADELRVDSGIESGQLVVRVRYPREHSVHIGLWDLFGDFELPSAEVRLGLQVPPGLPASVRTVSGDIRTDGVRAAQAIQSASGDVEVSDAGGAVRVETKSGDVSGRVLGPSYIRTASGDVDLDGARGPVDAHTGSGGLSVKAAQDSLDLGTVTGDIEVDGAPRGLDATTTSGGVVVRGAAGSILVSAASGDVDLGVGVPLRSVAVTTGSGDIEVRLGEAVSAAFVLRTSTGGLQLDSPIQASTVTRRLVTGRIRDGKVPIVLRSTTGDIHVYTGEKGS
jgi:hypothetical protein